MSTDDTQPPLTLAALRRLIMEDLQRLPGSTLVVLSRDPEGNGFSPMEGYNFGRYAPQDPQSTVGEVYPMPDELARDPELRGLYPTIPEDATPAVVLWPRG